MTFQSTVGSAHTLPSTIHPFIQPKLAGSRGQVRYIIVTLACLLISILFLLNSQSPKLHRLLSQLHITSLKSCIVYDRPPATFSASISWMLSKCMEHRNYGRQRQFVRVPESQLIVKMLRQSSGSAVTSLVSKRFSLTRKSVSLLQSHCANIIYITSTRPMKERILSKYGNGDDLDVQKLTNTEKYYEKFPNVHSKSTDLQLAPNYVIRSSHYHNDIRQLLKAFKCNHMQLVTHPDDRSSITDFSVKLKKHIEMKDLKFRELSTLAERSNNNTLHLIDQLFK